MVPASANAFLRDSFLLSRAPLASTISALQWLADHDLTRHDKSFYLIGLEEIGAVERNLPAVCLVSPDSLHRRRSSG